MEPFFHPFSASASVQDDFDWKVTPSKTASAPGPRTASTPAPSPRNAFSLTSNAPKKPMPFTSIPSHSLLERGTTISQRLVKRAL